MLPNLIFTKCLTYMLFISSDMSYLSFENIIFYFRKEGCASIDRDNFVLNFL